MKVHFATAVRPTFVRREDIQKWQDYTRAVDSLGCFDWIGTSDSSFTCMDTYVRTTLIALATEHARVGPHPTNPVTREPQIMASFLGGIGCLTNGRAMMSIATGDSAVTNIGLRPATRAYLEEYVRCVRDLLTKSEGVFQGRPQRVRWFKETEVGRVPIYICAEGPKMLHLAGRIGDGATVGAGLSPEVVKDCIQRIHAGAREAGRDPSQVEVWFSTRPSLHKDREKALEMVRPSVASILNHSSRFGLEEKLVPPELKTRLQRYVDGYDIYDHAGLRNARRMEELGLTQYAIKRYALAGNPKDWIERIEGIAEAGATRLSVGFGMAPDLQGLRFFEKEVLPHFS